MRWGCGGGECGERVECDLLVGETLCANFSICFSNSESRATSTSFSLASSRLRCSIARNAHFQWLPWLGTSLDSAATTG